ALDHPPEPLKHVFGKPPPAASVESSVHSHKQVDLPLLSLSTRDTPAKHPSTRLSTVPVRAESVEGNQLELETLPSTGDDVHAEFNVQRPIFALNAPLRLDAPLRVALGDI